MRLKTTALPLACALFLLTAFGSANAETADRSKPCLLYTSDAADD